MSFLNLHPLRHLIYSIRILLSASILVATAMIFYIAIPKKITEPEIPLKKEIKIPHAFGSLSSDYYRIGQTCLNLDNTPTQFSQRDLAQEFVFFGCNDRPDTEQHQPILFIGTRGCTTMTAIPSNTPMYISKNRETGKPGYIFSPVKTSGGIWMKAAATGQEAQVLLYMEENESKAAAVPPVEFKLKPEARPTIGNAWEIGPHKVDNSFLARQKVRWVGPDLFLAHHGGKDFEHLSQKQRVDFGEKEKIYSCFVDEGDCLVWKEDRWQSAAPGVQTQGFPLLQVKRIDSRTMLINLWSPDGKYRLNQTLPRTHDLAELRKTLQNFVYLGTKRWNEWIFQVDGKRQTIKPRDWWIHHEGRWRKLATKEEIDAFVNLKIQGDLFVVDQIVQEGRERFLRGNLFNAARTKMQPIQLPIKQRPISSSLLKTEKNTEASPSKEKTINHPDAQPSINLQTNQTLPDGADRKHIDPGLKAPKMIRGRP